MKEWTYRDEVFCRFHPAGRPEAHRADHRRRRPRRRPARRSRRGPTSARAAAAASSWAASTSTTTCATVEDYRRFLLNGIAWAAGIEVPAGGRPVVGARRGPRRRRRDYVQALNRRARPAILSREWPNATPARPRRSRASAAASRFSRRWPSRPSRCRSSSSPTCSGIDRSSVFRLANTLRRRRFLANPKGRKDYILGPSAWRLSRKYGQSTFIPLCHEHLRQLGMKTGETAHLAVREGGQALFIDHHASPDQVVAVSGQTGEFVPLHCTAHGKALITRLRRRPTCGPRSAAAPLQAHSRRTITVARQAGQGARAGARRRLHRRRRRVPEEVRCVAAPIRDQAGTVVASIGISAPSTRFPKSRWPPRGPPGDGDGPRDHLPSADSGPRGVHATGATSRLTRSCAEHYHRRAQPIARYAHAGPGG